MTKPAVPAITLVLIDDSEVVRAGLRALLGTEPDIRIAGEPFEQPVDGRNAARLPAAFGKPALEAAEKPAASQPPVSRNRGVTAAISRAASAGLASG